MGEFEHWDREVHFESSGDAREEAELVAQIDLLLEGLTPRMLEVVNLIFLGELSQGEAARRMGVTRKRVQALTLAVRSRLMKKVIDERTEELMESEMMRSERRK